MAALSAGVHTIGTAAISTRRPRRAMCEAGAVLVPTRTMRGTDARRPRPDPAARLQKVRALADRHLEAIATAHAAASRLPAVLTLAPPGRTASCPGEPTASSHAAAPGRLTRSKPSTRSPRTPPAPSGRSSPIRRATRRYDADLLALRSNPLEDLTVLSTRRRSVTSGVGAGWSLRPCPLSRCRCERGCGCRASSAWPWTPTVSTTGRSTGRPPPRCHLAQHPICAGHAGRRRHGRPRAPCDDVAFSPRRRVGPPAANGWRGLRGDLLEYRAPGCRRGASCGADPAAGYREVVVAELCRLGFAAPAWSARC